MRQSFAQDLKMVNDPGLDEFVGFERRLTPIYVL